MASFARNIATGFGLGHLRGPQGTWASAVALAPGAALLALSPWALAAGAAVACVAGLWAVRQVNAKDDPGWVVVDEIAGQWIALLPLGAVSWQGLLMAFLLFRLADITKPGPIARIDRRRDAIGVMGDDIAAGALAAAVLWGTLHLLPGLAP